ncbi:MAG: heme lyase CcmF/NrfE family subunit [Rhodospirillaceae bacterium]
MADRAMIAEAGHFALILAAVLALVQAAAPGLAALFRRPGVAGLTGVAAAGQALAMAVAMAALIHAFAVSDFSVRVVFENSHTAKPMLYKVAAAWGHHEGSLLLWAALLSAFGGFTALWNQGLPGSMRLRVLAVQGLVSCGVLAFLELTSNPFDRLSPAPFEGRGLNPLLQDPGLAVHPPLLYVGTVGVSVAFAFAVAALWSGRIGPGWARAVRAWTLIAWIFLTAGIALGSAWAYAELGWGGWWFWDPVENSALMPWLTATALLHAVRGVERRGGAEGWVVLLAILGFGFSLLGMFLVRSGVLTSVHAFAADPLRGVFILMLFGLIEGGALALFAVRGHRLSGRIAFAPFSRDGALLLNTVLLIVATGVVLFGTVYPLLAEVLGIGRISVGAPFFDATVLPLLSPLIALMAIGPLMRPGRDNPRRLLRPAAIVGGVGLLAAAASAAWGGWAAAGFGLAAAVAAGTALLLWRSRRSLTRRGLGMAVAHLGVAVAIAGMTGGSQLASEAIARLPVGGSLSLGGKSFTLADVRAVPGPNYIATRARVEGPGGLVLTPETRRYENPPQTTTEAAIVSTPFGDTYAVIGEGGPGGAVLRMFEKPLLPWLWASSVLMCMGGGLALLARLPRLRRRER